jgi:hypothetical protein
MMEAVSTPETLANFYQTTQRNIVGESHLRLFIKMDLKEISLEGVDWIYLFQYRI